MGSRPATLGTFLALVVRLVKPLLRKGFWSWIAIIGAPLCLGAATGFLTGQTGPDSTVVAAVLPAVLTAGGAAVLALKLKKRDGGLEPDFVVASLSVVLFSVSLLVGVYAALVVNEFAAYEEARVAHEQSLKARERQRKRYADALDFRRQSLEQCSRSEALVNSGRKALGLPALPSDVFCDIGPLHAQ